MEFVLNGTFWALIPAIVAIVLALCTKEVYSSLFIGIIIGGIFFAIDSASGFSGFLNHVFSDCLVGSLSDSYNVGILIFLVILGILVALINKAGGSTAFGNWAKKHIKSKVGAQVCTIILGILIFIDDYFNCLTVGSVMKPVTDKYGVSKEKLAYLIDSTAAPICIIAPISSWAAAVAAFVSGSENGIQLFCKAIPFNFYAIFTIIMMFSMVFMRFEFGSMSKYEKALSIMEEKTENNDNSQINKGRVIDLILPIIVLVALCVVGMIYSGGFFTKMVEVEENLVPNESYLNLITAFSNSDASVGLVLGSFGTLIITIIFYLIRKVLKFSDILSCVPEGFKAMVPAILILSLAWTLKSMTDSLGAKNYVAGLVEGSAAGLKMFLPAIIFIIACFLAFATGTSWGTFGILIPIAVAVIGTEDINMLTICVAACLSGAVGGDHASPISDTTILASAGAQCSHLDHVSTQIPYVALVGVASFIGYIVDGITCNGWMGLAAGFAVLGCIMAGIMAKGSSVE